MRDIDFLEVVSELELIRKLEVRHIQMQNEDHKKKKKKEGSLEISGRLMVFRNNTTFVSSQ